MEYKDLENEINSVNEEVEKYYSKYDKDVYSVYKITNKINGMIYVGVHKTNLLNDNYMGSGTNIINAIKEFGKENFIKETLFVFDNKEEMLAKEIEIVNKDFIARQDTYNIILGGGEFNVIGCISVKDKDGNTSMVHNTDPRYLSGELIHICKGKVVVKDKDENIFQVDVNDPRYLSRELVGITKGYVVVKDKDGNNLQVDVNDPRYLNGELQYINNNKAIVKDKDGNTMQVNIDDPRYLSGELVSIMKDRTIVEDIDSNRFVIDINDQRYLSGELQHINKDNISMKDKDGNIIYVKKDDIRIKNEELTHLTAGMATYIDKDNNHYHINVDDERVLSGELVSIKLGSKHSNVTKDKISKIEKSKIFIYHDELKETKRVIPNKINKYLEKGWILGYKKEYNKNTHNNIVFVKDEDGNILTISKDDPRYLSGELKHINKGTFNVKDKDGNIFKISKDDPRYLSGELISINKGRKVSDETKQRLSEYSKNIVTIHKNDINMTKRIHIKDLDNYIKDGWFKGNKKQYLKYIKNTQKYI